jgi:hypothetical protein
MDSPEEDGSVEVLAETWREVRMSLRDFLTTGEHAPLTREQFNAYWERVGPAAGFPPPRRRECMDLLSGCDSEVCKASCSPKA